MNDKPNILVRHLEPADVEAVHRICCGPKVVWGTLQLPCSSLDARKKRLAEPEEGQMRLVAAVAEEVVGYLSISVFSKNPRRRHAAALGMMVRDDWQGRGVGRSLMRVAMELCDKWLNITRLEIEVFVDNETAIRLYKLFNFEIEGTLRQFAFRDGRYADVHVMARVRSQSPHD